MKKIIVLISVILLCTSCAELKHKFVRKPKKEKFHIKRYYRVRKYDVHPSMDLYKKRYIFWKTWHKELIEVLPDFNDKKKIIAIEQCISNLMDMENMLIDEKAKKLHKLIEKMTEIEVLLKKVKITVGNKVRITRKIESLARTIKRNFSYTKIKGFLRDDFRR